MVASGVKRPFAKMRRAHALRGGCTGIESSDLGAYKEPLSSSILQGKYAAWHEMLALLGTLIGERIKGCVPPDSVIVPIPMPLVRRLFRRIDHSFLLAIHASVSSGLPMKRMLRRRNYTPQATKTASGRKSLAQNTMRLRAYARPQGKHVILVDDVLTTGKTLEVAANKLRRAGVSSVQVAVLAVTESPRKRQKIVI